MLKGKNESKLKYEEPDICSPISENDNDSDDICCCCDLEKKSKNFKPGNSNYASNY